VEREVELCTSRIGFVRRVDPIIPVAQRLSASDKPSDKLQDRDSRVWPMRGC
jgi:hypothetical protein